MIMDAVEKHNFRHKDKRSQPPQPQQQVVIFAGDKGVSPAVHVSKHFCSEETLAGNRHPAKKNFSPDVVHGFAPDISNGSV